MGEVPSGWINIGHSEETCSDGLADTFNGGERLLVQKVWRHLEGYGLVIRTRPFCALQEVWPYLTYGGNKTLLGPIPPTRHNYQAHPSSLCQFLFRRVPLHLHPNRLEEVGGGYVVVPFLCRKAVLVKSG